MQNKTVICIYIFPLKQTQNPWRNGANIVLQMSRTGIKYSSH